ncbi:hypothetical protein P7C70_g5401, partial [Phenoliferia sp. Uapishka_3]
MESPETIFIIGGGIIGCTSAYYLSHHKHLAEGTKIIIIEGSSIAAGASGKAGGLLALDWHGASTSSLAALSYRLHADLAAEHSGSTRWNYRLLDTLSISADFSASSKPLKSSKDSNFTWLSPSILTSTDIIGTTKSTAQVHPAKFTNAMFELGRERGVEVVYGTVESMTRSSSGSFSLEVQARDSGEKIKLEATKVVVAAGPWTGKLLGKLGVGGKKGGGRAKGISGSRAHSVVVRTPKDKPSLPAQALFTSIKELQKNTTHEPEIYNRPDGTAYACGPTDDSPLPSLASSVTVDPSATSAILTQIAALSPDYFTLGPGESGAQVEVEQACYLPVGSGDPVIGEVERGIWVASGHSCWGICNGPGTGLCIAEMILDGKATSANISRLGC